MSIYQRAKAQMIEKLKQGGRYAQQLIHTYKKEAISAVLTMTIALSAVGLGHAYYQAHINTIFHVYWQGSKLGTVDDPEVITTWIDHKVKEESSKFGHVHMLVEDDLRFQAEEGYKMSFDNKQALAQLKSEFSLQASAVKVVIDGEFIGYAPDEAEVEALLNEFKQEYVSEEFLATLNEPTPKKKSTLRIASLDDTLRMEENLMQEEWGMAEEHLTVTEDLPLNQAVMVDASIKQDVALESATVHPSQVLSMAEIRAHLAQSRVEEKSYQVQSGDVLGTIAQKNGLKLKELLALNPGITEETVLQIGQELVVEGLEPYITVVTTEKLKREEAIKYAIETKSDPNMYRGDTRVEREGTDGKKLAEYQIIKENGQEVNRQLVAELIVTEPVSKIIVRGEKVKPSRGSGQFAWPAVGGRITSGYGMRWGRLHAGIDISGVKDKTIKAADNGKVTTAGWHKSYGNHVVIDHDNGYKTLYAHLSSLSVKKGDVVKKGDKLGVMGNTGDSHGVHLHFEVIKNGKQVNPTKYVAR